MTPRVGLAIRIPDDAGAVSRIRVSKKLPLFGHPRKLHIPGAIVALVQSGGRVALTARTTGISEKANLRLVTGKFHNHGVLLHLNSLKIPNNGQKLAIRWRALGQFRYFDTRDWSALVVGDPVLRPSGTYLEGAVREGEKWIPRRPFAQGIPGVPHNSQEAELVRQYVEWLRAEAEFDHHYLYAEKLFTDIFDRSRWRLVEAKVHSDRNTVRTAVGQLFDYKRFYARTPSLGVLLGSKPSPACLAFLNDCGVTTVWRTPAGRFCDSTENRSWSSQRRCPK